MPKVRQPDSFEQIFVRMLSKWDVNKGALKNYILQHGIAHTVSTEGLIVAKRLLEDIRYVAHMITECTELISAHRQIRLYGIEEWCDFLIDETSRNALDQLNLGLVDNICTFTRNALVRSTANVRLHEYCFHRASQENITVNEMTRYTMNLGSTYMNFGLTNASYFDKAEVLFTECLAKHADILHTDPLMIELHNELAVLHARKGNMTKAFDRIIIVAADFKNVLGVESKHYLKARSSIAFLERSFGNYEQAQSIYEEVLVATERVLGLKHQDTWLVKQDYLQFLFDIGKLSEEQIVRELVEFEQALGPTHNLSLHVLNTTGLWYLSHDNYKKAEMSFSTLIDRSKKQVQPMMYINLAVSLHYQERYSAAEVLYERALILGNSIYAHGSYQLAQMQYQFANFLSEKPEPDLLKALNLYQASLDSFTVAYGVEHMWVRNVVLELVNVHQNLGKIDEAIGVLNTYIEVLTNVDGDMQSRLAVAWTKLGRVYIEAEDFTNGKIYLSKALDVVEGKGEVAYARKHTILWYLQKCAQDEGNEKQMLIWLEEAVELQYVKTPDFCSHNGFLMTTTLCHRSLDAGQIDLAIKWFNLMKVSVGLENYLDTEEQLSWERLSSRIQEHVQQKRI